LACLAQKSSDEWKVLKVISRLRRLCEQGKEREGKGREGEREGSSMCLAEVHVLKGFYFALFFGSWGFQSYFLTSFGTSF
jgi:hypothetical protein